MLRAGPFSDERIVRLANRSFVPFYFDLNPTAVAGDAKALAFVTAKRQELAGRSVPTPPVLFMNAEGDVLGEVSNYGSEDDVLSAMLEVLEKHPEYRHTPKDGDSLTAVEKAEWLLDLHDYDGAKAELKEVTSPQALYLRGHLARLERDWDAMERAFTAITAKDLADDVRMERAYRSWLTRDFAQLEKQLADFPEKSSRYTEACYFVGLAHFHQDRKDRATEVWKSTIQKCAQDPWIYRSDWAYYNCKAPKKRRFVGGGDKNSLLGRHGYMGRRNPDLEGPPEPRP